ncbi:glycosyltransferase family 15 protein [Mycena albidolilacea]|uniref:Glycosyltransferase family 15 protein n=1 Tax=Mycena albidolilacea TaxID=1033008 RepID=A0AAD6ZKT8_9AGAR|nr:glycosyltransferase family 15 protein [Mycena albidolilacea]
MMTKTRYIVLTLAILISLHYILSFSHEGYGRATSLDSLRKSWGGFGSSPGPDGERGPKVYHEPPYKTPVPEKYYLTPDVNGTMPRHANATIVMLARNGDLNGVVRSLTQLEAKFNTRFGYPYVFLNEEPFSDDFKHNVLALTNNKVEFGLIPKEHWYQPAWIDEEKARASRKKMEEEHVIYGGSVPYRNMCRFNSGFFFRHELLDKYRYYWRVEPDVRFFCTLSYDPFLFMQDEGKKYGFTISLPEYDATIPTLWTAVREFVAANPQHVLPLDEGGMGFLSEDGGETYNGCHFWSNFEIGDLDLWRGEAYRAFFEHLDSKGGFYYERWGDAPVHSIGAALFARKDQIHFFDDIGYRHEPFQHCPQEPAHSREQCDCKIDDNFDREGWSCLNRYDRMFT